MDGLGAGEKTTTDSDSGRHPSKRKRGGRASKSAFIKSGKTGKWSKLSALAQKEEKRNLGNNTKEGKEKKKKGGLDADNVGLRT